MTNPYAPPKASIERVDEAPASISVRQLVQIFQTLVVVSTVIGLFVSFWVYLPIPLSEEAYAVRAQAGAFALWPGAGELMWWICQPLWVLAGIGLCMFQQWGRLALVASYLISAAFGLLAGMSVSLPWEALLTTITTLMDGAILMLAFTNPIAGYFRYRPTASQQ